MSEPEIPQSHATEKEEAEIVDPANHIAEGQNYETEDPQLHTQALAVGDAQVASGASWLIWVAGCTMVNAIALAFNAGFGLALGLSSPVFLSLVLLAVNKGLGSNIILLIVAVSTALAGLLWFLSRQANLYQTWALVVGMVLILADSIVSLIMSDYFSLALHAWVLFRLVKATGACIASNKLYKAQVAAASGSLR